MSFKRTLATWMASLAALFMVAPHVSAEELSSTALLDRIESLESQLSEQQTQFASFGSGGADQKESKGFGCDECSKACCTCSSRSLYFGYEATILRPYISSNGANILGAGGWENDYGTGHRFILGGERNDGLGARLRYWTFNHGHDTAPALTALHIDMDVFDAEVTLRERMYNWNMLVSGGLRYAREAFSLGANEMYFEGIGPTVSFEASRCVGERGLYLVGNFRASMLIGEIHDPNDIIFAPPIGNTIDDEIATVLENQLGLGWSRELGNGELHLRALWETQFWLNDTFSRDANAFSGGMVSNLALSGATLAAEFRR